MGKADDHTRAAERPAGPILASLQFALPSRGGEKKAMTSHDDCCEHEQASFARRDILCGGGAAVFGVLVECLLHGAQPAGAVPVQGRVPEVDRLAVRILVDSYQFAVTPNTKAGNVEIQRYGFALSDQPPRKAILSEFGLSLHVESQRGDETRNVMIDFGFTPEALLNNIELCGIDPAALDALVLSHGHYDHFGGLVGFLRQTKGRIKARMPLYIGGEECFCSREWTAPPMPGNFGALDRKALEEADVVVTFAEEPSLVADHAFTTGQIGLTTFEQVLSPSRMRIGVQDGIGCFAHKLSEEERSKTIIPDQFRHEIATAYQPEGPRPRRADLVQPSRRGQHGQTGASGLGPEQGPRHHRRFPPRSLQGGLCPQRNLRARGDRPRLHHPTPLQRRAVLRDDQGGDAGEAFARLHGHAVRFQRVTGGTPTRHLTRLVVLPYNAAGPRPPDGPRPICKDGTKPS
jgi:7,8-dihydropterin-6-yl-methyl-4-(beta-D-ribofuranosyl)aminobenzene 5'-phosphate synthase